MDCRWLPIMPKGGVAMTCVTKKRKTRRNMLEKPSGIFSTVPTCIDLAERFGRRYRVEHEESYMAQYGPRARVKDPWLQTIPCRAGHIYPWGGSTLATVTNNAGPTARKLAALPDVTTWQDGSDGMTVLFDAANFTKVAKLMRPRRKRQSTLTAAQRAAIGRRLAAARTEVRR